MTDPGLPNLPENLGYGSVVGPAEWNAQAGRINDIDDRDAGAAATVAALETLVSALQADNADDVEPADLAAAVNTLTAAINGKLSKPVGQKVLVGNDGAGNPTLWLVDDQGTPYTIPFRDDAGAIKGGTAIYDDQLVRLDQLLFALNLKVSKPATKVTEFLGATNVANQPVPVGAIGVRVSITPPGCGGGSGRRGAAGTIRTGGGGAASTPIVRGEYVPIGPNDTTFGLVIPNPGAGGAAVTTDDTNGNDGAGAVQCSFTLGGVQRFVTATNSDLVGRGGAVANASGGVGLGLYGAFNTAGGGSSGSGTGVIGGESIGFCAAGAGGGGSITAANVPGNGGSGGLVRATAAVSAGGVVDGALPTSIGVRTDRLAGPGGGGGAASITKAAQAGADGAGIGAPGGGGGASVNGFPSGKGGNGGPGHARLEWVYA